jgi:hypothetical protein
MAIEIAIAMAMVMAMPGVLSFIVSLRTQTRTEDCFALGCWLLVSVLKKAMGCRD